MVSIFKKSQKRNKKTGASEQAIRLVLIIVWAIVMVVLGFYEGLRLSHHH
jgi:formate-dependent nitrite reductase membrane component NrfD